MKLNFTRALAFFDIEATGTNVVTDRIVEISVLKLLPDGETKSKTVRVNPEIPISEEAIAVHGITDEDVEDCPAFKVIAGDLYAFLENCDLAGYNSNKYDIPMLVEEFLRAGIEFNLKNRRFVDVQNIFHKMEQRTLKAAYKFYCKKQLVNAHSAEADVNATYEILQAQIERYKDAEYEDNDGKISHPVVNDIQALHDFTYNIRNVDLVGHIVYDNNNTEVFNFGKHRGKSVEDVFNAEPQYYDWMIKGDFPVSTKKVITAIKLRGFNKKSVNVNI